jgi:hypothetical protein
MNRRTVLRGALSAVSIATLARHRLVAMAGVSAPAFSSLLSHLTSPVLFAGDATNAYRDPAAIYHDGWFYLYFTWIRTEHDGIPYSYVAWSRSRDLRHWSGPEIITSRDKDLDFGSPGDVVLYKGRWVLCLQTYPRPNGERYGNRDSRIWTMTSQDLHHWSRPEVLRVKGPDVPIADMGRMIDPFLLQDKDARDKWWCFYKQNGISRSWSLDLKNWTYTGKTDAGENPCVIVDNNQYVLFHSPPNGIGVKRSTDLENWTDEGVLMLGQREWPWAQGRLTAGFVLDLRNDPAIGKSLMFFHGSQFPEEDPRGGFNNYASIGFAWSDRNDRSESHDNLKDWQWAGRSRGTA